jgi:hypothetical protein
MRSVTASVGTVMWMRFLIRPRRAAHRGVPLVCITALWLLLAHGAWATGTVNRDAGASTISFTAGLGDRDNLRVLHFNDVERATASSSSTRFGR